MRDGSRICLLAESLFQDSSPNKGVAESSGVEQNNGTLNQIKPINFGTLLANRDQLWASLQLDWIGLDFVEKISRTECFVSRFGEREMANAQPRSPLLPPKLSALSPWRPRREVHLFNGNKLRRFQRDAPNTN